jgi:hypothetical protein
MFDHFQNFKACYAKQFCINILLQVLTRYHILCTKRSRYYDTRIILTHLRKSRTKFAKIKDQIETL